MRAVYYLCLSAFLAVSCIPTPITPGNGNTIKIGNKVYTLDWAEEFSNTGLPDPAKWNFETGYVRNNEVQYYTDSRLENCKVENGKLYITALNDNFEGHAVTSASIQTKGIKTFKYGYLEVRAKMPHVGDGTWPAIWTLGENHDVVGWPRCGEIDIMEWVGHTPTVILGSTFLAAADGSTVFRNTPYIVSSSTLVTAAFHNYAIEWDSIKINYYFDNIKYATYTKSDIGATPWEALTKAHYLKLNLAMGGFIAPIGGGGEIDYSKFPYTFEVEYARYYK